MKQYLIYGTVKDWYYAQCGPEPFIDKAATKEAAVTKIAKRFYGMFEEVMDGLKMTVPSDPDELCRFLTGDSDDNELAFISDDNGRGVSYDDFTFLQEHGNPGCNADSATTMILGISEMDSDTGEIAADPIHLNIDDLLNAIVDIVRKSE